MQPRKPQTPALPFDQYGFRGLHRCYNVSYMSYVIVNTDTMYIVSAMVCVLHHYAFSID